MDKTEHNRDTKLNFTPEDIVNKDFKHKYRGYDITEVDPFLDLVIQDYETFRARIKTLEQENKRLVKKTDELSLQPNSSQNNPSFAANSSPMQNTTNYDILRRISNLERHVFGEQEAAKIAKKPMADSKQSQHKLNGQSDQPTINRF